MLAVCVVCVLYHLEANVLYWCAVCCAPHYVLRGIRGFVYYPMQIAQYTLFREHLQYILSVRYTALKDVQYIYKYCVYDVLGHMNINAQHILNIQYIF